MRRFCIVIVLCCLSACSKTAADSPSIEQKNSSSISARVGGIPLILVGEGGPSGNLIRVAARTYAREHGGSIVDVRDGDAFVVAIRSFVEREGKIKKFVYFGHGNHIGLFVNQEPNIHGSVYANDPRLNEGYRAASIYELPASIFASDATAFFYGCNIAYGHPQETFASAFANHFAVPVTAALGPTEFSRTSDRIDRSGWHGLPPDFDGNVYMVATYPDKGFIDVKPSPGGVAGFHDVHENMRSADAIAQLTKRGLKIDPTDEFHPERAITVADAMAFCRAIFPEIPSCSITGKKPEDLVRNLEAMKLLFDAAGIRPARNTPGSHRGYIDAGIQRDLLIPDFTNKKWLTRGEMAELSWNVLREAEQAKGVAAARP